MDDGGVLLGGGLELGGVLLGGTLELGGGLLLGGVELEAGALLLAGTELDGFGFVWLIALTCAV